MFTVVGIIGGVAVSGNQTNRTWQAALVARYPDLFIEESNGRIGTPGYPTCGDGWRDLVETAIGRIATAVVAAPSGSVGIDQIKEKFGALRLYWHGRNNLPETACAAIEEAIYLAEARSACTCEQCGEVGRLFKSGGWFLTACDEHGKGEAVKVPPGRENLHITRTLQDGKLSIASCRRYVRETDSFVDVSPSELGIKE
jgi:hypothetical protein